MKTEYEKWSASERDYKGYLVRAYVCSTSGYLNGWPTTLTCRLSASCMSDAIRLFTTQVQDAHMVNWESFTVVEGEQ